MKKLICIIAIALSSTVAANPNSFMYAAINGGIFQADFDHRYLDQTDLIPQNIVQTATQHSYTGGAAIGYRRLFNQNYFYGAELSGNIVGNQSAFQAGASTAAFSDNTQILYYGDLTFVPGINLSKSIATYLKVGLSVASIHDSLSSPVGFNPVNTSYNSTKTAAGLALGLGVSKLISKHVSLFTEANYHDYGTIKFSDFQNFSAVYTHTARVYSYNVVIGAAYKFDNV